MRKKKKTITLAKIRRHIRKACGWRAMDSGMPDFWRTKDYVHTKAAPRNKDGTIIQDNFGDYPYYTRSSRAIEEIAEKIYKLVKEEWQKEILI